MNKTINYQLTIVVPVYNEEDNIYSLEQKLGEFLPKSICTACVLFVNDGSRDNSKQRIMENRIQQIEDKRSNQILSLFSRKFQQSFHQLNHTGASSPISFALICAVHSSL